MIVYTNILKGFSHRKLMFDMLIPLNKLYKKVLYSIVKFLFNIEKWISEVAIFTVLVSTSFRHVLYVPYMFIYLNKHKIIILICITLSLLVVC